MHDSTALVSPTVRIYIEIDDRAKLVVEIDEEKQVQEIILRQGISRGQRRISFSYVDESILNGRSLSQLQSAL